MLRGFDTILPRLYFDVEVTDQLAYNHADAFQVRAVALADSGDDPLPPSLACLPRFAVPFFSLQILSFFRRTYVRAAPTEKFSGNPTIYLSTATNSFSQARQQTPLHERANRAAADSPSR